MTLGPLTSEAGQVLSDLTDADPTSVTALALETSTALDQILEFLEQIGRSQDSDLDAVHDRDWQEDADTLASIAQTLTELANQAEEKAAADE